MNKHLNSLKELAAQSEELKSPGVGSYLVGGAGIYGGGKLMYRGLPMILGQQRVYHGTSKENAAKINSEGLKTEYGGINGSSAHVGSSTYVRTSAGKIHVTPSRRVASGFATLNGLDKNASQEAKMKGMLKGVLLRSAGGGAVVTSHVPYSDFKQNFKVDPYVPGGVAFTTDKDIGKGFVGKGSVFRGVSAESIKKYAKNHPGRLAKGVGLGAVGAGMSALAIRQMMPRKANVITWDKNAKNQP